LYDPLLRWGGAGEAHDTLGIIPQVQDLDATPPHFITPFRALAYHEVHIRINDILLPIAICAKVGWHPSSLYFPFGYIESSFVDSLKFIFRQFPAPWLTYFEGAHIPVISYDFLDRRLITLVSHLHFTDQGLFIIEQQVRMEDLLCTQPKCFTFVPTPCIPANPFLHITPPEDNKPL